METIRYRGFNGLLKSVQGVEYLQNGELCIIYGDPVFKRKMTPAYKREIRKEKLEKLNKFMISHEKT